MYKIAWWELENELDLLVFSRYSLVKPRMGQFLTLYFKVLVMTDVYYFSDLDIVPVFHRTAISKCLILLDALTQVDRKCPLSIARIRKIKVKVEIHSFSKHPKFLKSAE